MRKTREKGIPSLHFRVRNIIAPFIVLGAALAAAHDAPASTASPDPSTWRWTDVSRIVVVADVHGAYTELVGLLRATGVIDESLTWSAGRTHLVSLGDLLDRGPQSRAVMDLLMRLQNEASSAGGRVHIVLGNHEQMNLIGDLRYVSNEEYAAFSGEEPSGAREKAQISFAGQHPELEGPGLVEAFSQRYPPGYFGHRAAFRPDGRYGEWLLSLPTLIVINDIAFVHGGLPKATSDLDPGCMNRTFNQDTARYLEAWRQLVDAGALPDDEPESVRELGNGLLADPSRCVQERALACEKIEGDAATRDLLREFSELSNAPVHGYDVPFWYRGTVFCRDILETPVLDKYLANVGARRVVVGHTPTPDSAVHVIRGGKVIMADTGMLVSYYNGRPAALVIENGEIQVQYLNPEERKLPAMNSYPIAYGLDVPALTEALASGEVASIEKQKDNQPWSVALRHAGQSLQALFYPKDRSGTMESELAAATLDDLLHFELIAPTVARKLEGTDGALRLMYPDAVTERQRVSDIVGFEGWCPLQTQYHLMYAFDLLTANPSRNADNLMYRRTDGQLTLAGFAGAFGRSNLPRELPENLLQLPPNVAASLKRLDEKTLQTALGKWVNERAIRALLDRRDELLKRYGSPP